MMTAANPKADQESLGGTSAEALIHTPPPLVWSEYRHPLLSILHDIFQ